MRALSRAALIERATLAVLSLACLACSLPAQEREASESNPNGSLAAAIDLWREFNRTFDETYPSAETIDLLERAVEIWPAALGPRYRDRAAGTPPRDDFAAREDFFVRLLESFAGVEQRKPFELTERLLERLCRSLDPYSHYDDVEEVARIRALGQRSGGGVGMELVIEDAGEILCHPFPDSAADRAGVRSGDLLEGVDGRRMRGATLAQAALAIAGSRDTDVTLDLRTPGGRQRTLRITREAVETRQVWITRGPTGVTIRIRNFNAGAANRLREALAELNANERLTLDLRGNPGGSLDEAVRAATLFLPKGSVIGHLQTRQANETFRDGNDIAYEPRSLSIQVDRRTASGAELFVAALLNGPQNASVYGGPTLGKAVSLDQFRLSSGGYLTLISGRLSGPDGKSWNDVGLPPDPHGIGDQ